jgi:predicted flap endonuclease-1-like 5' DNA nuclease
MAFLIDRFWLPLLLAALIGFMIAWATCKRGERKSWLSSWLPLGLLVAAGGVIAAIDMTLPGRYGMWLEAALLMFVAYLGGCCIACFINSMMFGPPRAAERDPNAEIVARKQAGIDSIAAERRERERLAAMATGTVEGKQPAEVKIVAPLAVVATTVATGLAASTVAGTTTSAASKPAHIAATAGKAVVGSVPPLLNRPRDGKKDDLTLIWGVAEKLEERMNHMGIWHFDQIAAWTPDHVKWFEHEVEGFTGRLDRDKWIEQCAKMAKGWRPDTKIGGRPKS